MLNPPLGVLYVTSQGTITGYPASERWLSQLGESFCDTQAYQQALSGGDTLVYRVSNVENASGPGQRGVWLPTGPVPAGTGDPPGHCRNGGGASRSDQLQRTRRDGRRA